MPTLILSPSYNEDSQLMWRAAGELGWDTQRLASWRVPDHLRAVDEPVLYVEALLGPAIAEQFGLRVEEPPEGWLAELPFEYRKREIALTTLGEARGRQEPAFIKPPNDKSFPADVYTGAKLSEDFDADVPVLVAEVVRWEKEFRCFLLDREVRAVSVYLRNGELQRACGFPQSDSEVAEAREFVTQVFADERVEAPRATVLDVGVIEGRGWAVVEQNGAWAAGIYGCDPVEVLKALRYAVVPSRAGPP
jgi:hypothetical protein